MDYTIKLFTHKIKANILDDLDKLVAFFKKHGINLDFTLQETEVGKQDASVKLFLPIDGKYDVGMYMYERHLFQSPSYGLAFNVTSKLRGIYLASTVIDDSVDYTWKSMAHEIMHTLFYKFNIPELDCMDRMLVNGAWTYYYKNEDLDAPDGNFAEAFKRLAPYINRTVTITRKSMLNTQVLGELAFGNFKCKTLERPNKNNLPNISCIPTGTYQCKYTFSPKFLKWTYQLLNVPKRSGIRIHSGNYFFDIEGCILLGSDFVDINKDGTLDVINSKVTVKKFEELMNKKDFTLVIK